jgi:hypothetical protein
VHPATFIVIARRCAWRKRACEALVVAKHDARLSKLREVEGRQIPAQVVSVQLQIHELHELHQLWRDRATEVIITEPQRVQLCQLPNRSWYRPV